MRHRAKTRYSTGKHRGKTIPQHEIDRRIAQSYGFNFKKYINSEYNTPQNTPTNTNTVFV